MSVALQQVILALVLAPLAVAPHIARWHPYRPEHDSHGRGIVVTVACLSIEQEIVHAILNQTRSFDLVVVANVTKIALDGFGLFVRGFEVDRELFSQGPHPIGERVRQLEIAGHDPVWIAGARLTKRFLVCLGQGGQKLVRFSHREWIARIKHRRIARSRRK